MYPSSDVSRVNVDAGTDSPALARVQLLDLIDKFNELRNFISVFIRGLLSSADAAAARSTLGLVIGTDVPAPNGTGATGSAWPIGITGAAYSATYAAVAANALGKTQSYGNYLPYRSLNLGFQNLAGRPIGVTFTVQGAINAQCKVVVTITHGGVPEDIVTMTTSESNGGSWNAKATSFFCVVPEGDFLTVSDLFGTNTLTKWTELR